MKEKRLSRFLRLSLAAAAAVVFTQTTSAQQVLYSETFETPQTADNWNINAGSARDTAQFGFDYSTVGIPPAPGSTTTFGLRMGANRPIEGTAARTGVSVSPKNQSFTGSYVMEFDMWANFPGPAPDGGTGSTQLTGGGIMTSGTTPNYDLVGDALWFAVTGEAGATLDFRAYFNGVNQNIAELFTAGGQGHQLSYYTTNFPGGVSAPAAQVAQYPSQTGQTANGSIGWKWRRVTITKDANIVTWDIDNIRIATVDIAAYGIETLGGNNILLVHSDINATATTAALDPMHFGLIDNLRVTTLATKVTATLMDPDGTIVDTLSEADTATVGAFRIVRVTEDLAAPMDVTFNLTGTATRGDATTGDYFLRVNGTAVSANTVTIPAGSTNVLVEIVANDDNVSELAETIIFNVVSAPGYVAFAPTGATIGLTDNDTPTIDISAVVFSQMFEGNEHDRIRLRLQRRGDIGAGPFDVNLAYAGTATAGSDFTPPTTVTFNPGDVTLEVDLLPLNDTAVEDHETVIVSVAAGAGYTVGTNNVLTAGATGIIRDDDVPAETIIFSDSITPESAANWQIRFGSINDVEDYSVFFDRNYADPDGMALPPAPHASGETFGLLVSVNKLDGDVVGAGAAAAGVNLYAVGQDFSGNYALRFDMYLMERTGTGTTENALFGINHDGSHTNWYSNSANSIPTTTEYDGIWASVVADASSLPADPRARAYQLFTAPGVTLANRFGPTLVAGREASELTSVFHNPPWTPAGGLGSGSPGNNSLTQTPSWAQVELRQENGVVTLSINNTNILTYTNTTTSTHGTIMLGYDDAYNSAPATPDAIRGGFVIYDNVRVVRLGGGTAAEVRILNNTLSRTGTTVQFDFTAGAGEPTTAFKLYSATNVAGPYAEDNTATITSLGGSNYRVTATASDAMRFYQIRRAP